MRHPFLYPKKTTDLVANSPLKVKLCKLPAQIADFKGGLDTLLFLKGIKKPPKWVAFSFSKAKTICINLVS